MTSAVYGKTLVKLMSTGLNLLTSNIKALLVDLADYGAAVTDATNATPIVCTSASHGRSNGQRILQTGIVGNTAANGVFIVANVTTNTYELQTIAGANVAGNGAYTSGGVLVKLDEDEFLVSVPSGARVGVSANLSSKSVNSPAGVFKAADVTISGVTGDPTEAVVYYADVTDENDSPLIAIALANFTPNGSGATVQHSNGAFALA